MQGYLQDATQQRLVTSSLPFAHLYTSARLVCTRVNQKAGHRPSYWLTTPPHERGSISIMILLPWLVKSEYTKSHINVNSGNPASRVPGCITVLP